MDFYYPSEDPYRTPSPSLHTSLLSSPPSSIPRPAPPPLNIPLRIPPPLPSLPDVPFVTHASNPHLPPFDEAIVDSKLRPIQCPALLDAHVLRSMDGIQSASKRLQAAMGVRNDLPFALPRRSVEREVFQNLSGAWRESALALSRALGGAAGLSGGEGGSGSGDGDGIEQGGLEGLVDEKTGRGLREFLLTQGTNVRKLSCRSVSFHDLTPEMGTRQHRNEVLGHYQALLASDRVDCYEVDLPATSTDEQGNSHNTTVTWLYLLISRPLLSYDSLDNSTRPYSDLSIPSSSTPSTTASPTSTSSYPGAYHKTPPNYPHPAPISWVVIAAPLAHLTSYPTYTEQRAPTPISLPHLFTSSHENAGFRVSKRRDYDFSHSGVPLFEFSTRSRDLFPSCPIDFLSIESLGGWHPDDPYEMYSEEEYAALQEQRKERNESLKKEGFSQGQVQGDERMLSYGEGEGQGPCPYEGVWWERFWEEMWRDGQRWNGIRRAMGRGKCRVVLRWEVFEREATIEEAMNGRDAAPGTGAVTDGLAATGAGTVIPKKRKAPLKPLKRADRAQMARRFRSGLNRGDGSIGLVEPGGSVRGKGKRL